MPDNKDFRELRLVAVYAVIAGAWFIISDQIFWRAAPDTRWLTYIQTIKDILFVGATTALLYFFLRRELAIRQRAREKLARERDFATALLNNTPSLILLLTPEGQVAQINRAFTTATGYDLNELWGRKVTETLAHPKDRPAWAQLLSTLEAGQQRLEYEGPLLTKDGGAVRLAWIFTVLPGTADGPRGIVGTATIVE